MGKGRGDKLASGGVKASFPASEVGITQERFDEALGSFDPKEYLKREEAREQEARELRKLRIQAEEAAGVELDRQREEQRLRDTNSEAHGDVSFNFGEAVSRSTN